MIFCFVALPIVVSNNFVSWSDINWETYPRQDFYQTPETSEAWQFWNFAIIFFGGFTMPMMMQRVYAAESFNSLKVAYSAVLAGNWLNMRSGIFIGTVGVQMLADLGLANDEIFGIILEAIIELGGFSHIIGIVATTAAIAAIMSTADSILISISHLMTSEVIQPMFPNSSGDRLTSIGRLCSLASMSLALLFSIYAGQNMSQLATIQYSIQMQMIPSFLMGLIVTRPDWDCHPWSLAAAAIIGTVSTFVVTFTTTPGHWMNFGLCGFLVNVVSLFCIEKCYRTFKNQKDDLVNIENDKETMTKNDWDRPSLARFCYLHHGPLTPEFISEAMSGIREAIVEPWFVVLILAWSILSSPFTESGSPPLGEDGELMWAPNLVGGIPSWVFRILVFGMVPMTIVSFLALKNLPDFLVDESKDDPMTKIKNKSLSTDMEVNNLTSESLEVEEPSV